MDHLGQDDRPVGCLNQHSAGHKLKPTCDRAGQDNALHCGFSPSCRLQYVGSAFQCWIYQVFLWVGSLDEEGRPACSVPWSVDADAEDATILLQEGEVLSVRCVEEISGAINNGIERALLQHMKLRYWIQTKVYVFEQPRQDTYLQEVGLVKGELSWERLPKPLQMLHFALVVEGPDRPSDYVALLEQLFHKL